MVKNKLKAWVLSHALTDINEFFECYNSEFNHEYNKKRYPNEVQRIAEYLRGSPSCIDLPFYYDDIRNLVLELKEDATERTLKRYENYFFEIVADILYNEYYK